MAKISAPNEFNVTAQQIKDNFPQLVTEILGDPAQSFSSMSPLENIVANSLVYVQKDKNIDEVKNSKASVVLVPGKIKANVKNLPAGQTWILSPNPELAMTLTKRQFFQSTPYRDSAKGIHPKAIVDPTAILADFVGIGPGAVVGARVRIGEHSFIGANAVIEADVVIGANTTIHPLVLIGHSTQIGDRCEVMPNACIASEGYGYAHDEKGNHYRIPHTGKVILHNDVHVGANTCIDRGSLGDSIIGQGTKIDNLCHLAHNTIVGKNCLITAQFGAAGSCTIGDNFVSGGKAALGGHLTIGNNVQIGGMSGVVSDITEPGQYGGYPIQPLREFLKTKAAILHLHEMRKQLKELLARK